MSYKYRLTVPKTFEYIKNELNFIKKNYPHHKIFMRKISFLKHIVYWQGLFKFYRGININIKKKTQGHFFINKNRLEIEITTKCNLKCYNCDRSCRQAPSNEYMTIEQIKYFVAESIKTDIKWPFIVIIGGEPTLHPNIYEVCDILIDYKIKHSPNTKLTISTNGFGSETQEVLNNLPEIIHQENSNKKSSKNTHFYSFNVAPVDVEEYMNPSTDFSIGCPTVSVSGTALTRYGYYVCGAAASIDRVLGLDTGVKNLKDISKTAYRAQLNQLCRYCGIFKSTKKDIYSLEDVSETWQKIYYEYNKKPPELKLYGVSLPVSRQLEKYAAEKIL